MISKLVLIPAVAKGGHTSMPNPLAWQARRADFSQTLVRSNAQNVQPLRNPGLSRKLLRTSKPLWVAFSPKATKCDPILNTIPGCCLAIRGLLRTEVRAPDALPRPHWTCLSLEAASRVNHERRNNQRPEFLEPGWVALTWPPNYPTNGFLSPAGRDLSVPL